MSTEFQQEQARIIAEAEAVLNSDDDMVPLPGESPLATYARSTSIDTKHAVKLMIAKVVAPLEQRITDLEEQARDRPGLKYHGPHLKGVTYSPGDVVTHDGSLWIRTNAGGETAGPPGRDFSAWTLCVKRGRDGKDWREPGRQP